MQNSVPFWSRVTPGIADNSYLVPFPVFIRPKPQEVLPAPPMQPEPQAPSVSEKLSSFFSGQSTAKNDLMLSESKKN